MEVLEPTAHCLSGTRRLALLASSPGLAANCSCRGAASMPVACAKRIKCFIGDIRTCITCDIRGWALSKLAARMLLVVRPGATSSVLAPRSPLLLVARMLLKPSSLQYEARLQKWS